MDKPETHAALKQDTEWTYQRHRQYWDKTYNGQTRDTGSIETRHIIDKPETQTALRSMWLWFVHSVSCPNTACVSGLSILYLVTILPVYLVCPFCVLSQYCLCLWFVHSVSCLNAACVSGLSIMCLVSILPVSLVCPFSVQTVSHTGVSITPSTVCMLLTNIIMYSCIECN
jgi:hypothetical protein